MSRVAWIADCHVGNHKRFGGARVAGLNQRCREGLAVLGQAVVRAVELRCDALVALGDLLDRQMTEPQVLAAVQAILHDAREGGVRVLLLLGNHEQVTDAPGDHALGPLAPLAEVVDRPRVVRLSDAELGLIPFRPGVASDWLPGALAELMPPRRRSDPRRRVIGLHVGIRDDSTVPWLRDAADAVSAEMLAGNCRAQRVGNVLAGNWHDRRRWKFGEGDEEVGIFQLGALVPTGFDNPGLDGYGTLAVWEEGAVRHEVLSGPRFVSLSGTAELERTAAVARAAGHRLYVQVRAAPGGVAEAVGVLGGFDGADLSGEVVVDGAAVEEQAREAAGAAGSAETLGEGLAAYVAAAPVEDGVDRAELDAVCRGYLRLPGGTLPARDKE